MKEFFYFLKQTLKRPISLFGALLICLVLLVGGAPGLFTQYDPYKSKPIERFRPPSSEHLFGTDEMGRDLFSRTLYGIGLSLQAGIITVLIATVVGTLLGTVAGYCAGVVGSIIMRVSDIFLAFPPLVMAMAIVAALGPSLKHASIAIGIVWWPQYARLAYAQVVSAKNLVYVEAARATGVRTWRIMFVHILPNCAGALIVKSTLDIGYAILYTASLSFLGLGASPPIPELGTLVTMGRRYLLDYWWYATLPGIAIFIAVMGFNLIGDGIRDAIDPNMRL